MMTPEEAREALNMSAMAEQLGEQDALRDFPITTERHRQYATWRSKLICYATPTAPPLNQKIHFQHCTTPEYHT